MKLTQYDSHKKYLHIKGENSKNKLPNINNKAKNNLNKPKKHLNNSKSQCLFKNKMNIQKLNNIINNNKEDSKYISNSTRYKSKYLQSIINNENYTSKEKNIKNESIPEIIINNDKIKEKTRNEFPKIKIMKKNNSCIDLNKIVKDYDNRYDNLYELNSNVISSYKTKNLKKINDKSKLLKKKFNYSNFFKQSKDKNISAKDIYKYYIDEECNDNIKPIKNFKKYITKKFKSQKQKFNKLYLNNKSYLSRIQEVKENNEIAYKNDFDLKEYQNTLLALLKQRTCDKNIRRLNKDFCYLNSSIAGFYPKGKLSHLADDLKGVVPDYLLEQFQEMDRNRFCKQAKFLGIKVNEKMDHIKKKYEIIGNVVDDLLDEYYKNIELQNRIKKSKLQYQ